MATEYPVPTTEELDAMFASLNNWTRWGADDERGTLNFLTDERRVAVARPGRRPGRSISLAHDLATEPMPDHPHPVQHHMLASGDARDSNGIEGYEAARDHLALDVHGLWTTHVDALSHMFVRGQMYGGRPASEVRSDGARSNTVMTMADGVVGRGVLLDVPRSLGVRLPRLRARWSRSPTSRRPRPTRVCGSGRATSCWWPGVARRGGERPGGLRRVLGPAPRVPPVAGRAGGGRSRQRRDLRPDALRRHPRLAVPHPPDRHRGHGPPPDRQCPAGSVGGAVRRAREVGVPVHHGAAPDPQRDRLPGQPGGGPVSTPESGARRAGGVHEELRALLQRYARAADERDVDALAALFHPDAEVTGARGTQTIGEWLDPCGRRGRFRPACTSWADPLIRLGPGPGEAVLDTYAVVYQLSDPASDLGDLTLGIRYLDDAVLYGAGG